MSTKPRISPEAAAEFFTPAPSPNGEAARGPSLTNLAGIPVASKDSVQLEPVLHECVRLYHANYHGCELCLNGRAAVAVQSGLNEDMVSQLMRFETSTLPDRIKAALRIASALASAPQMMDEKLWRDSRAFFSDQEIIDIVLLSVFCIGTRAMLTLGLDPGLAASGRIFYPADPMYGTDENLTKAIADLEKRGVHVRSGLDYAIPTKQVPAK